MDERLKFWQTAYKYARKNSILKSQEAAEDFASWAMLKRMEGSSLRQNLRHSIIDYLRLKRHALIERGDYNFKKSFSHLVVPLELPPPPRGLDGRSLEIWRKYLVPWLEGRIDQKDIGTLMGFGESRICQLMKKLFIKCRHDPVLQDYFGRRPR